MRTCLISVLCSPDISEILTLAMVHSEIEPLGHTEIGVWIVLRCGEMKRVPHCHSLVPVLCLCHALRNTHMSAKGTFRQIVTSSGLLQVKQGRQSRPTWGPDGGQHPCRPICWKNPLLPESLRPVRLSGYCLRFQQLEPECSRILLLGRV